MTDDFESLISKNTRHASYCTLILYTRTKILAIFTIFCFFLDSFQMK